MSLENSNEASRAYELNKLGIDNINILTRQRRESCQKKLALNLNNIEDVENASNISRYCKRMKDVELRWPVVKYEDRMILQPYRTTVSVARVARDGKRIESAACI